MILSRPMSWTRRSQPCAPPPAAERTGGARKRHVAVDLLSGEAVPDLHHVEKALATTDEVRVAMGRPGRGLEGFRSSHQDALAAQALVIRLGSDRRFTPYADVELIDALTKDRVGARRFVNRSAHV
ncbi:hypothetical protein [Streptomyces sp. NPDC126514]|uniref:hypothetical protein n=1 Tax=Streptomyces sp. NPDC126514 TaxID=3155210 RepID=UPI003325E30C